MTLGWHRGAKPSAPPVAAGFQPAKPQQLSRRALPTILRINGFRIGFYQADLVEPCHVHVRRQQGEAKYWMNPIERADSKGFRPHELGAIERILVDHKDEILAAWQKVQAEHGDRSSEN